MASAAGFFSRAPRHSADAVEHLDSRPFAIHALQPKQG